MATYYLSSVNGDDATADGTKALPYATLGAIPFTNGDLILVDSAHSTSEYVVGPDAAAGPPVSIVSVDWTTEVYTFGASFYKYSGFSCYGGVRGYGLRLGNRTSGYWCTFGGNNNSDILLRDCRIQQQGNGSIAIVGSDSATDYLSRFRFDNCEFSNGAGGYISVDRSAIVDINGGAWIVDTGTDGVLSIVRGSLAVDGLDLSVMTSGALVKPVEAGRAVIRNTPLPAGVSLLATTGVGSLFAGEVDVLYTAPNGSFDRFHRDGSVSTTTSAYRTGGAQVNGSPASFLAASTATASPDRGLPVPLDRRILDLSAARTIRVYFATDGAAALNNDELVLDVHYRKPSNGRGTFVTTSITPADTASALPSDTASTWNGLTTPVAQYVEAVIPADVAGDAHAEIFVRVCRPSAQVYVDPAVEVI